MSDSLRPNGSQHTRPPCPSPTPRVHLDSCPSPGIYHFTDEGVCSWYDFTKAIHRLAGIATCRVRPLHTAEYPTPASRPHYSVLDKTKIKQTYSLDIPYWEDSLRECLKEIQS